MRDLSKSGARRVLGWTALGTGLAAVLAAAGLAATDHPGPRDAGTLPLSSAPASPAAAAPAPAFVEAPDLLTPTRLGIAALGVDVPVDPAGVSRDGKLGVPDDPGRVGWWIGSAVPGAASGTVLVAGHVDTAEDGRGALFGLERLPIGAEIRVFSGGPPVLYTVTARRSYAKRRLPADLFTAAGPARLVVVTCGGTFRDGAYSRNVVVYAEPVRQS